MFRITVVAVLAQVETDDFLFFGYTQTYSYFNCIQDNEGQNKYEYECTSDTQRLNAQLVEATAVEKTRSADCNFLCQFRSCKQTSR